MQAKKQWTFFSNSFTKAGNLKSKFSWVIFIFCLLLYVNTVPAEYNLDDELVARNHRLTSKGILAIPEIFTSPYYSDEMGYRYEYRPLVLMTFAIENSLVGDNPHVSHFINALLYALLCLLVFVWLGRLLTGYSIIMVFAATLLFAAFPAHTEVVASIKNRDEIIGFLLVVAAATMAITQKPSYTYTRVACVAALFLLAMLGKTTIAPFAIIIPVSMILFCPTPIRYAAVTYVALLFIVLMFASAKNVWLVTVLIAVGLIGLWGLKLLKHGNILVNLKSDFNQLKQIFTKTQSKSKASAQVVKSANSSIKSTAARTWISRTNILLGLLYILMIALVTAGFYWQNPVIIFGGLLVVLWVHTRLPEKLLIYGLFVFSISHLLYYLLLERNLILSLAPLFFAALLLMVYTSNRFKLFSGALLITALTVFDVLWVQTFWYTLVIPFSPFFNRKFKWLGVFGYVVFGAVAIWKIVTLNTSSYVDPLILLSPLLIFPFVYLWRGGNWKPLFYGAILLLLSLQLYVGVKQFGYTKGPAITALQVVAVAKNVGYSAKNTVHIIAIQQVNLDVRGNMDRPLHYTETPIDVNDSFADRLGISLVVMGKYMRLLVLPYPLSFYYGYAELVKTSWKEPIPLLALLLMLLMLVLIIYTVRRYTVYCIGLSIIFFGLLFFSNLFEPLAGVMADRYLFLPSLGFCLLVAYSIFTLFKAEKVVDLPQLPTKLRYVVVVLLLAYSVATVARNYQWHDALRLMHHDISTVDRSAQAHNLLALTLMKNAQKQPNQQEQIAMKQEAVTHFRKALEIYPTFFNVAFDLGRVYADLNLPDSAIAAYKYALSIDTTFTNTQLNLGDLLQTSGQYSQAVTYYQQALKDHLNEYLVYDKLSYTYFLLKKYNQSIDVNKQALQNVPGIANPLINIGRTYLAMNQMDSAYVYFEKANRLYPGNPVTQQLLNQTLVAVPH